MVHGLSNVRTYVSLSVHLRAGTGPAIGLVIMADFSIPAVVRVWVSSSGGKGKAPHVYGMFAAGFDCLSFMRELLPSLKKGTEVEIVDRALGTYQAGWTYTVTGKEVR